MTPDPDPTHADSTAQPLSGPLGLVRENPWISAIMLVCTVGGTLAGPWLFDEEWSLLRQLAAGGFGGAWVGITITVTKMIGD